MKIKVFKLSLGISILLFILLVFFKDKNHFYKNIKNIDKPHKIDVLVNKNNRLDKFYRPNDLVKIDKEFAYKDKYLRKKASYFFEKMSKDARKLGLKIVAVSTYRSYFYQRELYNNYVKEMGVKKALLASAKPGHSEHQTGLALDIMGSNGDYNKFEKTKEFVWVKENAYKYGFILRYPKGKEHITGFKYEPWHIRYVGKKIAKYIYENNITLEEYKTQR